MPSFYSCVAFFFIFWSVGVSGIITCVSVFLFEPGEAYIIYRLRDLGKI